VNGDPPADNVTLTWVERYDFANIPHSSNYYLSGTNLRRKYDGTETTIARGISNTEFSQTGNLLTVTISCSPDFWETSGPVTKTYSVYLRAAQSLQQQLMENYKV
ncbi:hypothetical protein ACFLWE_01420, partial [Chloroflexota bacterium]